MSDYDFKTSTIKKGPVEIYQLRKERSRVRNVEMEDADKKRVKKHQGRMLGQKIGRNERMDGGNVRGVEAFVP